MPPAGKKNPSTPFGRSGKGGDYETYRARQASISRERSASGRDIGEIPPPANPERRERCRLDLAAFLREYFPEKFYRPWSEDLRQYIAELQNICLHGGQKAKARPRGGGKTTIAVGAAEWATCYGHCCFTFLVGDSSAKAVEILQSIKTDLQTNERLAEDFPEICLPIKSLEGIANRANAQTHNGRRTYIVWREQKIVLARIEIDGKLTPSSEATIQVSGITGGKLRGPQTTRSDGKVVRPDFVLIDDPQNRKSASNPAQCEKRERLIKGDIMGMRAPGKKFGAVMTCTIIHEGDLAWRMLNRELNPDWQGSISKLLYGFGPAADQKPPAWALWEEYFKLRADSLRAGNGRKPADDFYRANQPQMDAGLTAGWASLKLDEDISAIQYAMNLYAELGAEAFFAEYQNEPVKPQDQAEELTFDQIVAKADGSDRGLVPAEATRLVAFIDVGTKALYPGMLAAQDDFTGRFIDYGSYPDQKRQYFRKADIRRTLLEPDGSKKFERFEEALWAGLESLTGILLGTEWKKEDGGMIRVERCLIDARWGEVTDLIRKFCKESVHAALLTPSFGHYIGAASQPMSEWKIKPGDRSGLNWKMPKPQPGLARHVTFDSNYWKWFARERLRQGRGGGGCLTLFGSPDQHRMFADHILAEYPVVTEGRGRKVTEFKMKPGLEDNEFLDVLAGCCVALSVQGASLEETRQRAEAPKRRRRMSEWAAGSSPPKAA
jgi:hypothetical protein